LLLALLTAAFLRSWQLGEVPLGFYRDEAYNGLDAAAVLAGERTGGNPVYFEANNGREPAYIYLTSLAVALLGQTVLAVRITAAIAGTLTTILVYLLAKSWFDQRVGLLAAFIWAITVWPVHLSRIGLRPILMPFMMALLFWLGTLAYRKRSPRLWFVTGLVYGLAFYTYLAFRFTPILLLLLLLYLLIRGKRERLFPGLGWFLAGSIIIT
jgi:4-amino-4-deoxy-L-arabinose transferase-like glycosyltransferase